MPEPFLRVTGLSKSFAPRRWFGRAGPVRWALRDVSLRAARGSTLGIVGPSGSGKSTFARCVALFEPPTSGEILIEGRDLWRAPRNERAALRAEVQLIFQQPAATLNPRFTAQEAVTEPLVIQERGDRRWRRKRALELMDMAGLPAGAAGNRALEFSGGERQRLAIARALALDPKLLILDESLSGLDLSVQAQMVNLLIELQERLGLTYILISHDPALVGRMADEVVTFEDGRLAT